VGKSNEINLIRVKCHKGMNGNENKSNELIISNDLFIVMVLWMFLEVELLLFDGR
jgi:hypothetical protein